MSPVDGGKMRQWSEEVASDPASLSFLPLAAAYRDEGKMDAAFRLCLRGLERHPSHVDGHHLLGLLYLERGEPVKAFDEWDIALQLDPDHRAARREIGLLCLRQGDREAALRHLRRAREGGDEHPEVVTALAGLEAPPEAPPEAAPEAPPEAPPAAPPELPPAAAPPPAEPAPAAGASPGPRGTPDRERFAAAALAPEVAGAVLMDGQGYALLEAFAGDAGERGAEMAAHLSGASEEAERVARHLSLGEWKSILIETDQHVVHVSPVGEGMLAVAVRRGVPMGWAVRHAGKVRALARQLVGEGGA